MGSRCFRTRAMGTVLLVLLGSPALADDRQDCSFSTEPKEKRIAACSRLIASGRLSGEALAEAYHVRGYSYYFLQNNRQLDPAIADLTEAIRLAPNDHRLYIDRAKLFHTIIDRDRAIADLSEAIRIDPNSHEAYQERGETYRDKGDYDRAIADFSAAIRLEPDNTNHRFYRASVYYFDKRDYDRAIADMSEAIRVQPRAAFNVSFRGEIYEKKGDRDRALADFRSALAIDPDQKDAKEGLARLAAAPPAPAERAPAPPPAAQPQPPAPRIATAPVPATVKGLFEKYDLIGAFAADCSQPVSAQNVYVVYRANGDYVQRDDMSGAAASDASVVDAASEAGPSEIGLSMANARERLNLVLRIDGRRWRLMESTRGNGDKLVSGGRATQGAREQSPWLNKCG
jgi:tetratricopeptide (TPR) repeat protein